MLKKWSLPFLAFVLALTALQSSCFAKSEEWSDPQGKKFKGEPSAIIGPLALFRTGLTTMKSFPLHFLSDDDCVRFAAQLSTRPQRAQDWSKSTSRIGSEFVDNVLRVENGKLVPANLKGVIEPEFFIIFYANNGVGESWGMMSSAFWKYQEMQKQFPGLVEGLYVGVDDSAGDHSKMALSLNIPWLVSDYYNQSKMDTIRRIGPEKAPLVVVITRDGVPLFSTTETDEKKVGALLDELTDMLKLMNPGNPKSWSDRMLYQRSLQIAKYRTGEAAPVLVGAPLDPEMLKKYEVKKFSATLEVARDGTVKTAVLAAGFAMPEKMVTPISNALTKALFVPAVKNGQCVDGTFEYKFEAAP